MSIGGAGRLSVGFLACKDNTPQMWMDELERLRASGTNVADLNPLHAAAIGGRADIVQFMVVRGYDKDVSDNEGCTALQYAAFLGHIGVTEALLEAGADVDVRCHRDMSPLDGAAGKGHVNIARVLLEHGADVNAAATDGITPLHLAAFHGHAEMVPLLRLNGAEVDKVNDEGHTPLQGAAIQGHAATTQALLAGGADATVRHGDNISALGIASSRGHVDILMAFIEHGVDVNAPGADGLFALHLAVVYDKPAAIEVLVGAGADVEVRVDGNHHTPLFLAAIRSSVSAAVVLLKHCASVSQRNAAEQTPLHFAAASAGNLGAAQVVDLLLRRGADEKSIDRNGKEPADVVGSIVEEQDSVAEEVERVRMLLANAPADRAWRRRGFLVLCRTHCPGGRVQLGHGSSRAHAGIAKRTRSRAGPSRAETEWAGVVSMLMGVGADPISRMGDGADIIFETIVGFL